MTEQHLTNSIDLAVIAGDGIGPEIIAQARRVLDRVCELDSIAVTSTDYSLGAEHWLKTGETLPESTMDALKKHDAILFGAIGADPRSNPGEIDFVVVREGTEGPYAGNGGTLREGTQEQIATEVSLNTAHGVSRLIRYAFELAQARRKKLTLIHKTNVLVHAGRLYTRLFEEIGREFPDVQTDYLHIDAATIFMTTDPSRFDVIVTDNLFGDILTDQAGAVTGGIGYAASGNINAVGKFPSMFEPVHGSAPDIAGQNKANPTATILAAALLLRHLGYESTAVRIEEAVEADMRANGARTRTTVEVGDDVLGFIG